MRYLIAFILITLFFLGYSFVLGEFSSYEIISSLIAGAVGASLFYLFDRYIKSRYPRVGRYLIGVVLVILLIILAGAVWLWFKPLETDSLTAFSSQNAIDYDEAVSRVAMMQARQDDIIPACRTQLLTHGEKTDKVIVLLHGLTNCPAQFSDLGQHFYDLGYNVFIPRMPYHGYSDRMSKDQSQLTAEELIVYSNEVADIAHGLGDEITVTGFSAGGVLAAWMAQNRTDIDQVVLISPALGLASVPAPLTEFTAKTLLTLPDFYVWWNPAVKEDLPGLGSPRFSSHALTELLRLSEFVQQQAEQEAPQVNEVLAISNDFDFGVSQAALKNLITQWEQQGVPVETYTIPWNNLWMHDFIDPYMPENQPDLANPLLVELITGQKQ